MPILGVIASSAKGAPGIPTGVVATDVGTARAFNNGAASVAFTPGAGATATSFTVTSSPGGFTATGASSPLTVTGLQSSTGYTFTVTATNAAGTSLASAASASITATTVPQAPTIGSATGGNALATVTYTAGATGGKTITTFTATSSPGSLTGTGASPITVSGLTNGTAYTFTVTATNANGTSLASAASNSVTPLDPAAFESIATATPSGTNVSFTSIPSTYKHLQIRYIARDATTGTSGTRTFTMQFNSNTSTIYDYHQMYSLGTGEYINYNTNIDNISIVGITGDGATSNIFGVGYIDIIDYANTSKNKAIRHFGGSNLNTSTAINSVVLISGVWRNTAAITSIQLNVSGNFFAGTQFALYGIKG
jgi:hypothetical protein